MRWLVMMWEKQVVEVRVGGLTKTESRRSIHCGAVRMAKTAVGRQRIEVAPDGRGGDRNELDSLRIFLHYLAGIAGFGEFAAEY